METTQDQVQVGGLASRRDAQELVDQVVSAGRRVQVALRLARQAARDVQPTVEAEVAALVREASPPVGNRKIIAQVAGSAAQALDDIITAMRDADTIRARGLDALAARRALHATAAASLDVAQVDSAEALATHIQALHVPLTELGAVLDEAGRIRPAIQAALLRRLRAAAEAAIATHVTQITGRLRQLEAATLAVHQAALAGDPHVTATAALLAAGDPGGPPLPTIRWPRWSSAQSGGTAKSAWKGDPFQVPTIETE